MNGIGGLFGFIDGAARILSGDVRTDSVLHFMWDMSGHPDPDDPVFDPACLAQGDSKPGDRCV